LIKGELLHPKILKVVAAAGHGSQILIADGNYPAATRTKPGVEKVHLNLAPGMINVTQVLKILNEIIAVEAAGLMEPEAGEKPEIFPEFKEILSEETSFNYYDRFEFYERCVENEDLCLVIVTGEKRIYANILLTIGVV